MSRLPQVNSDKGNWGRILNTWLKHIAGFRGIAPARPASGSLPAGVAVNGTGYDTTDQFQSENSGLNFHNDFPANAPTGFTFIHTVHNRIYRREGNDWAVLLEGYTPQTGEHLWRRVATGSPNIRNIPSGGFVGVNTDPDARFHVLEDLNETIALFDGGVVKNIAEVRIRNKNQLSNGDALLTFETTNNAVWSVGITADYNNDNQPDNFFVISVNNRFGPYNQNDPADDYLIITPNNGAVGIGNNHVPNTNLPASATLPNNGFYKLDVQGNANVWEQTTTRNFRMWDQNPQVNSLLTSVDTQGNAVWRDFTTLGLVTNAENIPINNAPATNHGWSFAQKVGTVLQFRKITAENQNHGTLFRVRTDGDLIRVGLTGGDNGDIIWRNRNSGVYEWTNPSSIRDLLGLGTLTVGPLAASAGVILVDPNSFRPATSGNQNINIGFTGGSNGQFLTVNNGTYQWASFGTLTLNNTTQNVLAISPNTFVPNSNQTINIGLTGDLTQRGSLIAGSNVTLNGPTANRLVGSGDVTISVPNMRDADWFVAGTNDIIPQNINDNIYTNGRVGIGTNNPRSQAIIPNDPNNRSFGPVRLEVQDGVLVPNPNNSNYFGYFNQNGIFTVYLNEDNYRSSGTYHTGNYTTRILSSHSVAIFMAYGVRRPGEGNISVPSDVNPTIVDYARLNDDGTIFEPTSIPTSFEIFVDSFDRGPNSNFANRPVKPVFKVTDSGDVWIGGVSNQLGGRLSVTRQLRIGEIPQVTSATTVLTTDANGWVRRVPISSVINTGNFWSLVGNSGTNPANNFLGTTDNQPLVFRTNNSERVRIDTNGRVGIGTSNPGNFSYNHNILLHVHSSSDISQITTSAVFNNTTSAPNIGVLPGSLVGANNNPTLLLSFPESEGVNRQIIFRINGQNHMTILGNGRVGIGTSNPSEALHVQGNLRLQGALMPNNNAGTAGQVLVSQGTGSAPIWQTLTAQSVNAWSLVGNSGTNPANNFLGTTDNQPLVFRTNNSERVRIDTNGRVGIGTNNPTANLHVNGTVRLENLPGSGPHLTIDAAGNLSRTTISGGGGGDHDWYLAGTNNIPSTAGDISNDIWRNGRVGIGTNNPLTTLDLSPGGYGGRVRINATVTQTNAGFSQYNRGYIFSNLYFNGSNWITNNLPDANFNDFSGMYFANGGSLRFVAGQVPPQNTTNLGNDLGTYTRMTILPNGNVGIGTPNPAAKLHIVHDSNLASPQLRLQETQSNFARLQFDSGGGNTFWHIAATSNDAPVARMNFYQSGRGDLLTILRDGRVFIPGISNSNLSSNNLLHRYTLLVNAPADGHGLGSVSHMGGNQIFQEAIRGSVYDYVPTAASQANNSNIVFSATGILGMSRITDVYSDRLHTSAAITAVLNPEQEPTPNYIPPTACWVHIAAQFGGAVGNVDITNNIPVPVYLQGNTVNAFLCRTRDDLTPNQNRVNFINCSSVNSPNGNNGSPPPARAHFVVSSRGIMYLWADDNTRNPSSARAFKNGTSNTWELVSDGRLKTNIRPISKALEKIKALRGVEYEWINKEAHAGDATSGFIAQEIEKVFPECVAEMDPIDPRDSKFVNGGPVKTVGLTLGFHATMVEAIKEQQQMIEELQKTVAQQQQLIELQNQKIAQLEQKLEELANKLDS